jgi:hypothetical protein
MPDLPQTLMFVLVGGAFSGAFIGVMSQRMREWRWRLYACAIGVIIALADVSLMQQSLMRQPVSTTKASAMPDIPALVLWAWVPVFVIAFLGARRLIPSAQRKLVETKSDKPEDAQDETRNPH